MQLPFKRILENRLALHFSGTVVSLLIIFSRRTDAFLNPQFWAEDGKIWYADAYNRGAIYSFLTPEAGYYQTISRVVAVFAQLFPLSYGPAIFNLAAVAVKLLVVNFIVSTRLERVVPSVHGRMLIAFIYLALPHSYETHANLTNVQWHLALLSFLVLIAAPSRRMSGKVFEVATVALSALSGPFCLMLLPIAAVKYFLDRDRSTIVLLGCLTAGSVVQISSLLTMERPSIQPLGANVELFLRIVGGHIFVSSAIGERGHEWIVRHSVWTSATATIVNFTAVGLLMRAFVKGRTELRLLIVFALFIVAGAIISPAVSSEFPQWTMMVLPAPGSRYWLIPTFCWIVSMFFLAAHERRWTFRYTAVSLMALSSIGIIADWTYPPFPDLKFQASVAAFEAAPAGQEVSIPIHPDREMKLIKK